MSSEVIEIGAALEHEDGRATDSLNVNVDTVVSFAASGETQVNSGKDNSNISNSPSYCDDKSAYSSMVILLAYFLHPFWIFIFTWEIMIGFTDPIFTCSAQQVGYLLSFMIGILQNFLEDYGIKYIKAMILQFSI